MCQCEYNVRGFLENECFECVEEARPVDAAPPECDYCEECSGPCNGAAPVKQWQPQGGARFEGHDAEGLAIYSNVVLS